MAGNICDVCNRPEKNVVGVFSSGIGPVSWAYCEDCYLEGAEPEMSMLYLRDVIGTEDLHPASFDMKTFVDGKYMSFRDWLTLDRPRLPEPTDDDMLPPEESSDVEPDNFP